LRYEEVSVDDIKPNEYNPNVMTKRVFNVLVENIKEEGEMLQPILVTQDYVIIDGEHRWRASKEAGIEVIPIMVTETGEEEAKLKTIAFNKIRGEYDVDDYTELLKDLSESLDYKEIADSTSIFVADIKALLGDYENESAKVEYEEAVKAVAESEDKVFEPRVSVPEASEKPRPLVNIMGSSDKDKGLFDDEPVKQTVEMKVECTLEELGIINKGLNKLRRMEEYEDLSNGAILAKFITDNL